MRWWNKPLFVLGWLAITWAVVRACVQAVIIDEAETYEVFVSRSWPAAWAAGGNNHVLNSVLIKISTSLFGLSHFSLRLPALMGALLYIAAAYVMCILLSGELRFQVPSFLALVYSPFILDFFSAARGYSLAVGCLLAAIALPLWAEDRLQRSTVVSVGKAGAISAGLLGASFCANFAFAFVDFSALLLLGLWIWRRDRAAIWATLAMPLVAGLFCGVTLTHWRDVQVYDGARSVLGMLGTVWDASLYQLPFGEDGVGRVQEIVLLLALLLIGAKGVVLLTATPDWSVRHYCGVAAAVILALALGFHSLARLTIGLLFPHNRSAIWVVPLATLIAAAIVAAPVNVRWARILALAGLWMFVGSYVLSLRLHYFREWQYLEEVKDAYWSLRFLGHQERLDKVISHWRYSGSLNFYRTLYGGEEIPDVTGIMRGPYPRDGDAYVLYGAQDQSVAADRQLRSVYNGPKTSVLVASVGEVTSYEDFDPTIKFSGSWLRDPQFKQASRSSLTYSSTPGDAYRFKFEGEAVTLVYTRAFNRGIAEVSIDGKILGSLDMYSKSIEWQAHTTYGPLGPGEHELLVKIKTSKNPAATDRAVDIDRIVVARRYAK